MMISPFRDFIEAVRDATDIAEMIGADVQLRRSGRTLVGLSPFRGERSPSFVVWPDTRSWHDFSGGGGVGGDVFDYIQLRDGVGFAEAVTALAQRTGIRRPGQSEQGFKAEVSQLVERRELQQLLRQAARFYHRALSEECRDICFRQHYGFSDEIINELQLGWASGGLFEYFRDELNIPRERALKTGLFVALKGGEICDFFDHRLIFPYWYRGQVVYFIARKTQRTPDHPWEKGKYKKLQTHSERRTYISRFIENGTFYGEDAARGADTLMITEGVTDCISAMQAEIRCLSPVTTRFRKKDISKLIELTANTQRVVICNDVEANGAGLAGALETAEALHNAGRDVRIAVLPRAEGSTKIDVNEYLKQHDTEAFKGVLEAAPRYPAFLIGRIPAEVSGFDLTPMLEPVLEVISRRPALEQSLYIDMIARRFPIGKRLSKQMLKEAAARIGADGSTPLDDDSPGASGKSAKILKGRVYEAHDHYYAYSDGEPLAISSFRIQPTERIALEDEQIIVGDVITDQGKVFHGVQFRARAWNSRRSLIQSFPNADMQWTGTDDNVQGVLQLLSRYDVPIRQSTHTLGYLTTPDGARWVSSERVFGPDGDINDSEIVFLPNGSTFPGRVRYPEMPFVDLWEHARSVLPELLLLNEPRVILPMLGWFFAAPLKPRLIHHLKHFPILCVWGTQGSGKTSLISQVFWRLFGVTQSDPYSVTESEFALIKLLSSTNSVPVCLDEYKPGDMSRRRLDTLHRLIRRIYSGETEERGRRNLDVIAFHLQAPLCISGEARPEDPAIVDRMVSVTPSRNYIHEHSDCRRAFNRLRAENLGVLAAPYIRFALAQDTAVDLQRATTRADALIDAADLGERASLRMRDNLRVVVFGLEMFLGFVEHLGLGWTPKIDFGAAVTSTLEDLLEGDQGAFDLLDELVEACAVLAFQGKIEEGRHFACVEGLLCLHLRSCWEAYLEHCRRTGRAVDSSLLRAIRRQIRENHDRGGYVKAVSKTVSLGSRRPRTVAIDLEQAGQFLDIDLFPTMTNRVRGHQSVEERS